MKTAFEPLAALVDVDQRGVPAAAAGDVMIERVVTEVGFGANEPAERGRRPLEHLVPRAEPRQLTGRAIPEGVRIAPRVIDPALDDRGDERRAVAHG